MVYLTTEVIGDVASPWLEDGDPEDCGETETPSAEDMAVAVTGHIVVYDEIVSVVTDPILAGQSVTVAAQEVTV